MGLNFYKYSGAGNLFLIADGRRGADKSASAFCVPPVEVLRKYSLKPATISGLCRKHAVDGLIVLEDSASFDFGMKFYNPDGSCGMMCGNGGRCIAAFAEDCGVAPSREDGWYCFEGPDAVHRALVCGREGAVRTVRLGMRPVDSSERVGEYMFINTGARHLVVPVADVDAVDVASEGAGLRSWERFAPQGVNVDFVEWGNPLRVRTFEKGVEGETLACGTGITACALAAFRYGIEPVSVESDGRVRYEVQARGGLLSVDFIPSGDGFRDIYLTGPAERICNI